MTESLDELLELQIGEVPTAGIKVGDYRLIPNKTPGIGKVPGYLRYQNYSRIALTPLEYSLLSNFFMNPGRTIPSEYLLEKLRGANQPVSPNTSLLRVHLSNIRNKLPHEARGMIRSINGRGYVLPDNQPEYERRYGSLALSLLEQTISLDEVEVNFTPTEFILVKELILAQGNVVRYAQLAHEINADLPVEDKSPSMLRAHIYGAKSKLGDFRWMVQAQRNNGYYLTQQQPESLGIKSL
ncbi:MAG: winged helix-turn-helix domain-containing protein [Nanoarchaeota archaeon]